MPTLAIPPPEALSLAVEPARDHVVVTAAGELELASTDCLERQIRDLLEVGWRHVVVDLTQVTFMDSSGLRALLALGSGARESGTRLELVPGPQHVQRLFELTGTLGAFEWRARRGGRRRR